jgi:hypothetical protein
LLKENPSLNSEGLYGQQLMQTTFVKPNSNKKQYNKNGIEAEEGHCAGMIKQWQHILAKKYIKDI